MIVVVNDEPRVREALCGVLERAGFKVRAFARGADALEAVAWSAVELVISDRTNFPMDGVEFVRRVRERSNVPVVFVSAWAVGLTICSLFVAAFNRFDFCKRHITRSD